MISMTEHYDRHGQGLSIGSEESALSRPQAIPCCRPERRFEDVAVLTGEVELRRLHGWQRPGLWQVE